jgi:hypothetical protein
MIARDESRRHEEIWLLLPWLANGRLSADERELAEQHVRSCRACERELGVQQRMCEAFTAPERVIYAPGPSFRKLLERIDADGDQQRPSATVVATRSGTSARNRFNSISMWRPPGLAWAASFLLFFGLTGVIATAYHWSRPVYQTHTEVTTVAPNVLHIAVDRRLTIGDVEEILRINGARIVEGPGSTGVLGVMPEGVIEGVTPAATADRRLRQLAARLGADSRVLWVQPLEKEAAAGAAGSGAPEQTGER